MFVKTLVTIALMAAPLAAQAHGHHHSKPLAFEELPQNCQAHFKRAEACYAKASGPTAEFHRGNTKTLLDAMPAAPPQHRERIIIAGFREQNGFSWHDMNLQHDRPRRAPGAACR